MHYQYRPVNTVPVPDSGLQWAECKSQWLFTADLLESVAVVQPYTCRREYRLHPELWSESSPEPLHPVPESREESSSSET